MNAPYPTAAALVASVRTLVTLSDVYLKVKELAEDPDAYMDDVVNAISWDPGITARLLRYVNSAFFGLPVKADNVRRAVNMLGMQRVHDIVLAATVAQSFAKIDKRVIDVAGFWDASIRCAVNARLLARRCDVLDYERLFVAGLLADIGHLVMYQQVTAPAGTALEMSVAQGLPVAAVERRILGYDYAEVGGLLLRAWRMPESLTESVEHQLAPSAARVFRREASIVHIARVLARPDAGELDAHALESTAHPDAWRISQLEPAGAMSILSETALQVQEAKSLLLNGAQAA